MTENERRKCIHGGCNMGNAKTYGLILFAVMFLTVFPVKHAWADEVTSGAAVTDPLITEPTVSGPAITEPAVTEPVVSGAAIGDRAVQIKIKTHHNPFKSRLLLLTCFRLRIIIRELHGNEMRNVCAGNESESRSGAEPCNGSRKKHG